MPPKDDDDPASTKDVVTKRQKQLFNREEMDLNLIAESLDGYVLTEFIVNPFRNIFGNKSGSTKKETKTGKTGKPRGGGAKNQSVTPSGGGSDRGPVGNAASQRQADPDAITKYKAKSTPGGTRIPSASGRDAGSAARARLVAPRSSGASVLKSLKGIRGGVVTTAINLATAGALDKFVVQPLAREGGKQLAKGIASATGNQDRFPSFYGKQGPNLTIPIVKGIKARDAKAKAEAETEVEKATSKKSEVATATDTQTDVEKGSTTKGKVGQATKDNPTSTPQKSPTPIPVGLPGRTGRRGRRSRPKPQTDKKGKLPRFSPPQYGGKIGRRTNPQ